MLTTPSLGKSDRLRAGPRICSNVLGGHPGLDPVEQVRIDDVTGGEGVSAREHHHRDQHGNYSMGSFHSQVPAFAPALRNVRICGSSSWLTTPSPEPIPAGCAANR